MHLKGRNVLCKQYSGSNKIPVSIRVLWAMLYADDAGIASRSQASLEKMMTVIVEVCAAFGLIVSEKKTGTMHMRPPP